MDFINDFSSNPMSKLRCITNLSELPRSPTNLAGKALHNENKTKMHENDSRQVKRPIGLQKPQKKLIFSTETTTLQKEPIDQGMVDFIYNKENLSFQLKPEQKRQSAVQNAPKRKNPVTNRVESVNIRRIIDQEKSFEVPLGAGNLSQDYSDYFNSYSRENCLPSRSLQTGSFVETMVTSNDLSCEHYLQNQTVMGIPQFEEYFQLGRNAMVRQSASAAIRSNVLSTKGTDESKNYGSFVCPATQQQQHHQQVLPSNIRQKPSRRTEIFQTPKTVCEFIMWERHSELLM